MGLDLSPAQMCTLLGKARYEAKVRKENRNPVPAYRQDIMHQRDIVEDMLISYGYNKVVPKIPKIRPRVGGAIERFCDDMAEVMVAWASRKSCHTCSRARRASFRRWLPEGKIVEIENFVSSSWCVLRNCSFLQTWNSFPVTSTGNTAAHIRDWDVVVPMQKQRPGEGTNGGFPPHSAAQGQATSTWQAQSTPSCHRSASPTSSARAERHPHPWKDGRGRVRSDVVGIVGEIHPKSSIHGR